MVMSATEKLIEKFIKEPRGGHQSYDLKQQIQQYNGRHLSKDDIREIIKTYISESQISVTFEPNGFLTQASADLIFQNLDHLFQTAQSNSINRDYGIPNFGINANTAVPEALKPENFKTADGTTFDWPITKNNYENNAAVLLEFLEKKVQIWDSPVISPDGKKTEKNAEIRYGTPEGKERLENQEAYNIAYMMMYKAQLEGLKRSDRKDMNKHAQELFKILGVEYDKKQGFTGVGSIHQLRVGIAGRINDLTEAKTKNKNGVETVSNTNTKVNEDTYIDRIRYVLDPECYKQNGGNLLYNNYRPGVSADSQDDINNFVEKIRRKTSSQAVTDIFQYMETAGMESRTPNDHADKYILGWLVGSPDKRIQKYDKELHDVCRIDDLSSKFNFSAKVPSGLLKDELEGREDITVGDYIDHCVKQMVKQKAKVFIEDREKHGIAKIIDTESARENLGVRLTSNETKKASSSKTKYPKVSKPPYRALAFAMKMINQLASMMCQSFQKMVASSGFYESTSKDDFDDRILGEQNKKKVAEDFNLYLFGFDPSKITPQEVQFKQDLVKKMCEKFRDLQAKGKKDGKAPEGSLNDAELAAYTAEIKSMIDEPSRLNNEVINKLLENAGGKADYDKWRYAKNKAAEQVQRKADEKANAEDQEKCRILDNMKLLGLKNPKFEKLLDEYELASDKDTVDKLWRKIKFVHKIEEKDITRDDYVNYIQKACINDVKTLNEHKNLCKIFQLHDVLRINTLTEKAEATKNGAEYSDEGKLIMGDVALFKRRNATMKTRENVMDREYGDAVKAGEEAGRARMQKIVTDGIIGTQAAPPRGKYSGSGIDTVNPNECLFAIMDDIRSIAKSDKTLGKLTNVIKGVEGFENVDLTGKNIDIEKFISALNESYISKPDDSIELFDKTKFMQTFKDSLGIIENVNVNSQQANSNQQTV